ncbi:MAG: class I SAM-dependent methyltransferase [Myxococcales bacterium]|nr:class I SAM-dependent methyltransferase [Myxococcales bacterium]
MSDLPEHARENQRYWNGMAHEWVAAGERNWAAAAPTWGIWKLPESELQMLPADMSGMDAIELGCGTGYVSSWMARRGATVTGIDLSERQLQTAERLSTEHGVPLTLIHGTAEAVPAADGSFDFAISEYGAAIWCDPHVWIPEAHRLLRPGGTLVFLGNTPWVAVCTPPSGAACEEVLHRPYLGMKRIDWTQVEVDPGGMEFSMPVSAWLRLFRDTGFELVDFLELQAPEGESSTAFSVPAAWARQWPAEHVFKLRKR